MKKLSIIIASVLGATTLVAAPASANAMTVVASKWDATATPAAYAAVPTTAGAAGSGDATTTAIQVAVPANNVVDSTKAIRFVATVVAGSTVSVTSTNVSLVTALHTDVAPVTAASGASTLSIPTGTGTSATFFAFTKTTAIGTVTISSGGTTRTYYLQGTVGGAHTIALTAPDSSAAGTLLTLTATVTDVFGNKVGGHTVNAVVGNGTITTGGTIANGGVTSALATDSTTVAGFGTAEFKVQVPASGNVSVTLYGTVASLVAGLPAPVGTTSKSIVVRDLATELAAANALLAAERTARAADKAAADTAAATAKAAADAAALKAAADLATANAEIAKLKVDAVTAKAAADKALADAIAKASADAAVAKAASDKAFSDLKRAFNKLARQWNKSNPKAKVALVK